MLAFELFVKLFPQNIELGITLGPTYYLQKASTKHMKHCQRHVREEQTTITMKPKPKNGNIIW